MTLVLMALGGTEAKPQHACRKIASLVAIDSVLVRYIASETLDNRNKKQRRQNGQLPPGASVSSSETAAAAAATTAAIYTIQC